MSSSTWEADGGALLLIQELILNKNKSISHKTKRNQNNKNLKASSYLEVR